MSAVKQRVELRKSLDYAGRQKVRSAIVARLKCEQNFKFGGNLIDFVISVCAEYQNHEPFHVHDLVSSRVKQLASEGSIKFYRTGGRISGIELIDEQKASFTPKPRGDVHSSTPEELALRRRRVLLVIYEMLRTRLLEKPNEPPRIINQSTVFDQFLLRFSGEYCTQFGIRSDIRVLAEEGYVAVKRADDTKTNMNVIELAEGKGLDFLFDSLNEPVDPDRPLKAAKPLIDTGKTIEDLCEPARIESLPPTRAEESATSTSEPEVHQMNKQFPTANLIRRVLRILIRRIGDAITDRGTNEIHLKLKVLAVTEIDRIDHRQWRNALLHLSSVDGGNLIVGQQNGNKGWTVSLGEGKTIDDLRRTAGIEVAIPISSENQTTVQVIDSPRVVSLKDETMAYLLELKRAIAQVDASLNSISDQIKCCDEAKTRIIMEVVELNASAKELKDVNLQMTKTINKLSKLPDHFRNEGYLSLLRLNRQEKDTERTTVCAARRTREVELDQNKQERGRLGTQYDELSAQLVSLSEAEQSVIELQATF